ncbi:MAG: ABC transporter permease subunit, partial [Planctomycetota bacterium]
MRAALECAHTGWGVTPVEVRSGEPTLNDFWRHPLGTDPIGRDLLSRLLYGARISLAVGILSTVLLVFFGVVIGSIAGYFGGWVDMVISRIIEIFQSIPAFFLILTAVTMIPDDKIHPIFAIVFFIAIVRWTGVARLVRAEFFKLKEQEFVIAAQALGFSNSRVIFKHVLPNALGPVLVAAAFSVAAGILTESAISFLGLGIKLPIPSWGSILNEAKGSAEYWWINLFPGLLIFLTVFCYNVVGEGVRDALDPRRKL